jgi:tetratricopeptide (TPR) repeat protein
MTVPQAQAAPQTVSDHVGFLFSQGKHAEAVTLCQKFLQTNIDDYATWGNLGIALRKLNQEPAALICLKKAIELGPDSLVILRHHAHCLRQLGRKEEALQAYANALRLFPQDFDLNLFYAVALSKFGQEEQSLTQINLALKLNPGNTDALWHRADVNLRLGRFSEGWKDFETRWNSDKPGVFSAQAAQEKTYPSQRWAGEDLTGKTIFIYGEQGYGDTILCSRYIPLIKARGAARIIFGCANGLHKLFEGIPGLDRLADKYHIGEKIDYHIPVMTLPGLFGTTFDTIPPAPPLHMPETPPAEAAKLLTLAQDRLKVGIVWSGSPGYSGNKDRAVPFTRFLPLAEIPGVQLFSLQKGPQEKELAAAGAERLVLELGPHLNDFTDTAAVLKQLDLVIMTDSSVAHLAGSIGTPVWNLLPVRAYWIYGLGREDSPWYPSMRLFRQPEPGDWDSVFRKVAAELEKAVIRKHSAGKKA